MDTSNFGESVFKPSVKDPSEYTIDGDMIKVLIALDGEKPVKEIARATGFPVEQLGDVVEKLSELGLVEPVAPKVPTLGKADFDLIVSTLARIVGPIADVLVDEAVSDLGYTRTGYPVDGVADLIDALSREIDDDKKRVEFQKSMLASIKSGRK